MFARSSQRLPMSRGTGVTRVAPSRFPLLSQPVVETALRIPSWLWIENGRDRAVARTAYSGFLPASVLDRRTKGGLDSYAIAMLARNRSALQPFLLEGTCRAAGYSTGRGSRLHSRGNLVAAMPTLICSSP
jgi:hypothetical protein